MKRTSVALALGLLAGCRSTPGYEELPAGHPADPGGASTAFDPGPNPFAVTPTYPLPLGRAPEQSMPGMRMPGMPDGAGLPETGSGEDGEPQPAVRYTCPMHPEVIRSAPGTCPECGMALRPEEAHSHGSKDPER